MTAASDQGCAALVAGSGRALGALVGAAPCVAGGLGGTVGGSVGRTLGRLGVGALPGDTGVGGTALRPAATPDRVGVTWGPVEGCPCGVPLGGVAGPLVNGVDGGSAAGEIGGVSGEGVPAIRGSVPGEAGTSCRAPVIDPTMIEIVCPTECRKPSLVAAAAAAPTPLRQAAAVTLARPTRTRREPGLRRGSARGVAAASRRVASSGEGGGVSPRPTAARSASAETRAPSGAASTPDSASSASKRSACAAASRSRRGWS